MSLNKIINNDLEREHINKVILCLPFLVKLEYWNVGFWGEGKTREPREKPPEVKEGTNNQLKPTYGIDLLSWVRATLVGGECSHHCAIVAPQTYKPLGSYMRVFTVHVVFLL